MVYDNSDSGIGNKNIYLYTIMEVRIMIIMK